MVYLHHGAGQILIFYFIFILKKESHKIRFTSIALLAITSIFSLYNFKEAIELDLILITSIIILSIIGNVIGNKLMSKIKSQYLNLISGFLLIIFSVINFLR